MNPPAYAAALRVTYGNTANRVAGILMISLKDTNLSLVRLLLMFGFLPQIVEPLTVLIVKGFNPAVGGGVVEVPPGDFVPGRRRRDSSSFPVCDPDHL